MSNWKILQIMPATGWVVNSADKRGESSDALVGWALVINEQGQTEVRGLVAVNSEDKGKVMFIDETNATSWSFYPTTKR